MTYSSTMKSLFGWAESELAHVGRIAAVEDSDIQYSYALSTVNGMAHLKDALFELVGETEQYEKKRDLLRLHDQVIRVMKHLIYEYNIDLEPIRNFNVRGVLSNLSYLDEEMSMNENESEAEEEEEEEEEEEGENTNDNMNTNENKKGGKRKTRKGRKGKKVKKTKKSRKGRK
jgi:hypothetical protein